MKKWYIILSIIIVLCIGSVIWYNLSETIPSEEPKVTISYAGNPITSETGEHNWNDGMGGSTFLVGDSYTAGKKSIGFNAKAGGEMEVVFSSKPPKMMIDKMIDENTRVDYKIFGSEKKYSFSLPTENGEYIFEVTGWWDDTHQTSNIFKVEIK